MNTESWQKIKEIFTGRIELPVDQRAAYLDKCDLEFRYEVEKLINATPDCACVTMHREATTNIRSKYFCL